jgi:hypothetical protein
LVLFYTIACERAKDISDFSAFKTKEEVILLPGTSFYVKSSSLFRDNLYIVHLEETSQATTAIAIRTNLPSFVEKAAEAAIQHFKKQYW